MTTKNFWTDQRQEVLINMWKEGRSARVIAEHLGDGITRNAVIGKANRLGLSQPNKRVVKASEPERVIMPTAKQCQWPFGDPGDADFHFCGKPIEPDWPYCLKHCQSAYRSLGDKDDDAREETAAEAAAASSSSASRAN